MNRAENEIWTIQKILTWTAEFFTSKKIPSARLDSEILLATTLGCRRLDLYLKFDQPLKDMELKKFKELVVRRSKREPVAYITGVQEFYGRNFIVGPGVLIPRPETEHLIGEVLSWFKVQQENEKKETINILDVGSGSGCIGLTLALEIPQAQVVALEKMEKGTYFTRANAEILKVDGRVTVLQNDFCDFNSADKFDIIVANPPYIALTEKDRLQEDVVQYEPAEALFGGPAGHETLQAWLPKMMELLAPQGLLVAELGFDQGEVAKNLALQEKFQEIEIIRDYSGNVRLLKARKESHHGQDHH